MGGVGHEDYVWRTSWKQARERCLARLQRLAPQVLTIQFEEVKGVEKDMLARRLAPQPFEHREPVLIAGDRLAIDQALAWAETQNDLGVTLWRAVVVLTSPMQTTSRQQ
jgi:hypothetical protein